jgi:predicted enzyme related to lactoylglutathione lyase
VFCLWEPKDHTGLRIEGQNASFCWADLSTPDQQTAAKFYTELFGWTLPPGDSGYLHIKNGDAFIGGIPPAHHRNPHAPPHWLIYLQADDCAAGTANAKELGANVYMGPMTMENVGVITVLADPQGAAFSLFQPARRS